MVMCVALLIAFAQPQIVLNKTYGSEEPESIQSVTQIGSKIYSIGEIDTSGIGDINCNFHGDFDIRLLCHDISGNIIWQKALGGTKEDSGWDIIMSNDSCLIIVGTTGSNDGDVSGNLDIGGSNIWIVKVDTFGNILWQEAFGGPGQDIPWGGVTQLRDGKFLVGCISSAAGNEFPMHSNGWDDDIWLSKINANGTFDTAYYYGGNDDDIVSQTIELNNGDLVSCGGTFSHDGIFNCPVWGSTGYWDGFILKTDSVGNVKFIKKYSGDNTDDLNSIIQLPDKGFIVSGQTSSSTGNFINNVGGTVLWAMRLDSSFNYEWSYFYGGNNPQDYGVVESVRIKQTALVNGRIVLMLGESFTATGQVGVNYGHNDFWIFAIDTNGVFLGGKVVGGSLHDQGPIGNSSDGNLTCVGLTESNDFYVSNNHGQGDGWLIGLNNFNVIAKVDPENNCVKINPNPLKDKFFLAVCPEIIPEQATLFIFSMDGKQMLKKKITNETEEVMLHGFKAGTYLYTILNDDGSKLFSGKLIVQQ